MLRFVLNFALVAASVATSSGCTYQGYLPPRGDSCDTYQGYPVCRCQTAKQDGADINGPLCDYPGGDVAVTSFVPVLGEAWDPGFDFGANAWQLFDNGTVDGMSGKFKCCNVPNVDDCCPQFDTLVTKLDDLIVDADAAYGAGCCQRTDTLLVELQQFFDAQKAVLETRMMPTMAKSAELAAKADVSNVHQYMLSVGGSGSEYQIVAMFKPNSAGWNYIHFTQATGSEHKPADGLSWASSDRKEIHFALEQDYYQCAIYGYEDDQQRYPQVDLRIMVDSGNHCDELAAGVPHCAEVVNVGTKSTGLMWAWQAFVIRCYKTPEYSQWLQ